MQTTSIGGRFFTLQGAGYERIGPANSLGEQRAVKMGSKRHPRGRVPLGPKEGSWTRRLAWPSQVTLARALGSPEGGNEKSGSSMRNNRAAFAAKELVGSAVLWKLGRLLDSDFGGVGVLARWDAASSTQASSSSPHWKFCHNSEAVGFVHDGQGFRKPTISVLVLPSPSTWVSEGRVCPGEGAHDGRYEVQPEAAWVGLAKRT